MKKRLLTAAVAGALAIPGIALAQVTVFGTIDTGLRNQSKVVGTPSGSVLEVTDGLRTTNRLGFRGSEDVGGGMMVNFWMEGQHSSDTGGLAWNSARKSVVGLSTRAWAVDLGRDYTANFKAMGVMDPMSFTYTGLTPTAGATFTAGTRSSNMVTAAFNVGGGTIRAEYAAGETPGDKGLGTRTGFGVQFPIGPVNLVAAMSNQETAANIDTSTMNIGAAYTMGAFTFRGGLSTAEVDSGNEHQMIQFGVQYAISPTWNGRFAYYDWGVDSAAGVEIATRKTMMVAVDYIMSKRTTLYIAYDNHKLTGTPQGLSGTSQAGIGASISGRTLGDGASGLAVGLAHSF